jgi:hypothetical protein
MARRSAIHITARQMDHHSLLSKLQIQNTVEKHRAVIRGDTEIGEAYYRSSTLPPPSLDLTGGDTETQVIWTRVCMDY